MRLGIVPPVVQRNPRFDPPAWEQRAGIDELARIAERADELGYEFICFPNHVAVPTSVMGMRGATYWDPAATMGFIAARTSRIKLCAYVIVLGYYHPLQIAKTFGTVDRLSGGRLILGVGVGSLQPEFELLGVDFEGRGARADDALKALRASLGKKEPAYTGEFYRYEGFVVDPNSIQERVPIWVGGRTKRSLRRALELADGWAPFRLTFEELKPMVSSVDIPAGFDLVLAPEPLLDPLGHPNETAGAVERYRSIGATKLNLRFEHSSLEHYLEQLEAMTKLL